MKTNNKKNKISLRIRNTVFAVFMSLTLLFCPAHQAHAALWPAVDPIIKTALEEITYHIRGVILGILKQQAARMLNSMVTSLVGGGSSGGSAMFITDWEGYLVSSPEQSANAYVEDLLSTATRNRGSLSSYIPSSLSGLTDYLPSSLSGLVEGASDSRVPDQNGQVAGTATEYLSEGFGTFADLMSNGGNYINQMVDAGRQAITDPSSLITTYEGDPSQMFVQGNFKNSESYLSNKNPMIVSIVSQSLRFKKLQDAERISAVKAIANSGFKSVGEGADGGGAVSMPGSLIKETVANVQDIGNKIIAGAQHPEEVITAVVTSMIDQAMQSGMNMINQQINNITSRAMGQLNQAIGQNGPGQIFQYANQANGLLRNISNSIPSVTSTSSTSSSSSSSSSTSQNPARRDGLH